MAPLTRLQFCFALVGFVALTAAPSFSQTPTPPSGNGLWVHSVAFSRDSTSVLSGSDDPTIKLWDVTTGRQLRAFNGHSKRVNAVAVSPDGTQVLSGSDDNTTMLWNVATGQLLRTFQADSPVIAVAFSPDGNRVFAASAGYTSGFNSSVDGKQNIWDAASGQVLRSAWLGLSPDSAAFSRDGNQIVVAGIKAMCVQPICNPGYDNPIRMTWIKLLDAATGEELRSFSGVASSVAFSPDGARIVTGGEDKMIKLWDATNGQLVRTLEGHLSGVWSVAFSPDGSRVLSGSADKTMKLWNATTGQLLQTFNGHSGGVTSVAFSPDGNRVLSGSGDGTMKLWNATSGQLLLTFE
jgi:WD40 repeat protein